MANRDEHDLLGALLGVVSVSISANAAGRTPSIGEIVGGALFGVAGSRVPDMLEPAIHPNHRGPFHSVAAVAATGHFLVPAAHRAHTSLAAEADREPDPVARFLRQVAAGAMVGVVGGYTSHVAADATTPKSIPLLGI